MPSPIATWSSTPGPRLPSGTPTTADVEPVVGRLRPALLEVLACSQRRGAIGPGALERHLAHAAGFLDAARHATSPVPLALPCRFLDLGSGGGLPGLVVAALLPAARGTLLDGRTERAALLERHVGDLDWSGRLEVRGLRAEVAGHERGLRGAFTLVVARGFGPPAVTAECAAPFLVPGGLLVVSEPPEAGTDRWPAEPLRAFGLVPIGGAFTLDTTAGPARYQVLRQEVPCPARWPRRTGVPAKRPAFRD